MLNYQKMDTFDAKLAMTTMSAMYRKGSVSAPISGKMKLADLIDLDYRLLRILSRLEINLGFGEASISQVCQRAGVDEKTFILYRQQFQALCLGAQGCRREHPAQVPQALAQILCGDGPRGAAEKS